MEKQPESLNIKDLRIFEYSTESDEKSSSPIPRHDDSEMSAEQASSNREDYDSKSLQSDIIKKQTKSSNIENSFESKQRSSSSIYYIKSVPRHDISEMSAEQASSNREDYGKSSLESDITKKQHKSSDIENSAKSNEKSPSPSISKHDALKISVEQDSSNRTDNVRGQILVDNDAGTNVTEYNYSSESTEINLPESSTTEPCTTESSPMELSDTESGVTEIAQPSTSKSTLELKSQSLQECTQKNDSDNKSKENQDKCQMINTKAEESTDLMADIHDNTSNLSASEPTDDQAETMNDKVFVTFLEKYTSTSMHKSLQWKCLEMISKYICKILIFFFLILPLVVIMIIKKLVSKYMIRYDKAEKIKKLKGIQDTDIKIRRKEYFTCLICFIILLILILPPFLFQFHFRYRLYVCMDGDDMHIDTFATTVVELEEQVLDHDATIRVLTEYLERDTPPLKVVALIGDTSVDKPYTVDIIKKRLRKRRSNSSSLSLPTFVVLENLRAEHSKVVINYVNMYQQAYGDRDFTILAVFKVEQIDDDLTHADINHVINTIKDNFIEANIIMKIIPFKPLSEETLEKYIKNTAKNIGQTFSQDQIDHYKRRLIEDDTDCQRKYGY